MFIWEVCLRGKAPKGVLQWRLGLCEGSLKKRARDNLAGANEDEVGWGVCDHAGAGVATHAPAHPRCLVTLRLSGTSPRRLVDAISMLPVSSSEDEGGPGSSGRRGLKIDVGGAKGRTRRCGQLEGGSRINRCRGRWRRSIRVGILSSRGSTDGRKMIEAFQVVDSQSAI